MTDLPFDTPREPGHALRWGAAALLVAGLHAGAGWGLVGHSFAPPPPPDGVAGVTIDLEPVAVPVPPPEAPAPLETAGPAPTPQVAEAPATLPEPVAPVEPPPPPPEPPPSTPEEPPVVEAAAPPPPPEPTPVALPEMTKPSDAVLAPMPPARPTPPKAVAKPAPPKPVVKPPAPKPDPRKLAQEEARREAQAEAREQRRADRTEARAARAAQAREGGGEAREFAAPTPATSGAAVSSWRGEVVAHLNAYKPASPTGNGGTVRVAFTVDRGGRVTSASVSGSSGDDALDAAAVTMVRRASPVPAPPPELGGRISLAVPVRFH